MFLTVKNKQGYLEVLVFLEFLDILAQNLRTPLVL